MPVYLLGPDIVFPPVEKAEHGLLAVGGDLSCERLLHAYSSGIFPWYSEGEPILWHSPDPRFVLTHETFRVPKSLARVIRSGRYRVTMDTAFEDVVEACASTPRGGQQGTWITEDMKTAYTELHRKGFAHSVEAWRPGKPGKPGKEAELVGGLYGVSIGTAYFGESMFSRASDASKVAFVALVRHYWRGISRSSTARSRPTISRASVRRHGRANATSPRSRTRSTGPRDKGAGGSTDDERL